MGIDQSDPMAPAAFLATSAAFLASSEVKGRHDVPSFVLLDTRSYVTGRPNSTTATSKTSTDLPIEVTFCTAHPPDLSYLFIHCPGLEVDPTDLSLAPKIISADADLVLLRVPRDPMARMFPSHSDYFVYKLNPEQSELYLLPNPYPECFNDNEIAILSYGNRFTVATLRMPLSDFSFMLHLYHSGPDGKPGSWTSQRVSVEEPQRDSVCPIPDSAQRLMYHVTTKVITLGGAKGTVGFVDLWRGILLCDLLEDSPKLRDMPLPLPAKGNWSKFLNSCPYYCRDIAVNQSKDTIKYVEMEITRPTKVARTASTSDSDSYYEWLSHQKLPRSYSLAPGSWKITTWSMPIPTTSWDSWHRRCTIRSEDINLPSDNTRHYELLCKLMSSGGNEEENATEATLSLGCLRMAYPTMSIADDDDDVVYLLSKGTSIRSVEMVVAVDASTGTLQGVVKLDTKRHVGFMRCCLASGISKHLKTTDRSRNRV